MVKTEFRAWDKINKQMVEVLNLHFENNPAPFYVHIYNHAMNDDYWTNTDESILMQYTGLKDRNDKKIFDGDILRWIYWEQEGNTTFDIYIVSFKAPSFVYNSYRGSQLLDTPNEAIKDAKEFEIIGNIYENKNLISEIKL